MKKISVLFFAVVVFFALSVPSIAYGEYDDGYEVGYTDGFADGFRDGEKQNIEEAIERYSKRNTAILEIAIVAVIVSYLIGKSRSGNMKIGRKRESKFNEYYRKVEGVLEEMESEHPSYMWDVVRNTILGRIENDKNAVKFFSNMEDSMEHFLQKCVFNVSSEILESGNFHVYRGALNDNGEELLRIYKYAGDKMVKSGLATKDWIEQDKETLMDNIHSIG